MINMFLTYFKFYLSKGIFSQNQENLWAIRRCGLVCQGGRKSHKGSEKKRQKTGPS
jgi:hypothetical protein